jgi:glycosyltransferase involved in cell wall biosynthesis
MVNSVNSIKLVSIVEATTITGPMKPLLMFSKRARMGIVDQPVLYHSLITTVRSSRPDSAVSNAFLDAARADELSVDIVRERRVLDVQVIDQMVAYLMRRHPDVVETHDFKSHFLMRFIRARYQGPRFKWLAFHHGYTKMSWKVRAYQQLDRVSLRAADRVVTLCQPFVTDLIHRGVAHDRINVIANAVDLRPKPQAAEAAQLRRSLGIHADDIVIVAVGRLSLEKGLYELLEVFRRLQASERADNVRLLLVGDGGEATKLRAQARIFGDRVIFAGHQSEPWPFFCIADVFALPSHTEGSPLVLFEAMSASLPIVASAVGGIPEVVRDKESALLVPPLDVERLYHAIFSVVTDANLRRSLGQAAFVAVNRFTPDQYCQNLFGIYSKLLSSGS